jgi:hypothetical protein
MRIALALVLLVHGFAHLVGFLGAWRLTAKVPYRTTLLAGRLDIGDAGIKVVGVLWLLAAIALAATGLAALARLSSWPAYAQALSVFSLGMCVAGWPEAKFGVAVNVILIAILVVGSRAGWFTASGG